MDYGGHMHKEADLGRFQGDTFWGGVLMKLKKLGTAIEMYYGEKMNIDNFDYRWVDDRINYLESNGRKLSKEEMSRANNLWNKYNNKPYNPDIKI